MNGAETIVRTLLANDVNVCFANPGTSEMHFVGALDRYPSMRCVLGLFEGVVTGAADGYGRMMDRPAATLLHLGPGLGNGLANLHNAFRARSPILNIVGDHATYHKKYNAPLTSDVEGVARPFSTWLKTTTGALDAAADVAEAISAAKQGAGAVATLILPANAAWDEAPDVTLIAPVQPLQEADRNDIREAASIIRGKTRVGLILGARALRTKPLEIAGKIRDRHGIRLLSTYGIARIERGAGRVAVEPIPYAIDPARAFLEDFDDLILIGGDEPVAFFAYPGKPGLLAPPTCRVLNIATPDYDLAHTLAWLADEVGVGPDSPTVPELAAGSQLPTGRPTPDALAQSVAALLPENAIIVDEAVSVGHGFGRFTKHAHPHDFLKNFGGSIGFALPAAIGVAIACPDRKVLCLEGDGSGMYTLQALWTQARENLDIVNVIFANRAYAVLRNELKNVGVLEPGPQALSMLDISRPTLDWCGLARSQGVEAVRVETMEEFNKSLAAGFSRKGPMLIEVIL